MYLEVAIINIPNLDKNWGISLFHIKIYFSFAIRIKLYRMYFFLKHSPKPFYLICEFIIMKVRGKIVKTRHAFSSGKFDACGILDYGVNALWNELVNECG